MCGFEGFVMEYMYKQGSFQLCWDPRVLLKITLFSSDVLFVLLLSRLLFWASGIAKICTKFIWGRLCVKVKVVPFLFQAFRFNFANYKTHASIFIGISKQMKSSPFSSWSFHLGLKTWFWWVSWPLTTFDNMFDITPCWPSCADLLFMVNMGKRGVWWWPSKNLDGWVKVLDGDFHVVHKGFSLLYRTIACK